MTYKQHPLSAAIYQIRNTSNGRVYVGSAVRLAKRWKEHLRDLRAGRHHSQKLQYAWNKYGEAAFCFEVLEHVEGKDALLQREQAWIDSLNAASRTNYNVCGTAGSQLGMKASEATRKKLSAALAGNTRCLGFRHSPEARERMGAGKRGQMRTDEQKARMSAAQIGNAKKRGYVTPDETKQRLALALRGNKNAAGAIRSEETRRLIGEASKARWAARREAQA